MSLKAIVIKISTKLIMAFKVEEIAGKARAMSAAVFGAALVFTGVKPFTAEEVEALVTNYTSARADFIVGGLLMKPAYVAAKKAIQACMVSFGKYVSGIAVGDLDILKLSTLPTTEELVNYLELIIAGATASGVSSIMGITGQLTLDCTPFGLNVTYFVILSEGVPLPAGVTISSNGQINIPAGCTVRIVSSATMTRKKIFKDLTPLTPYYAYYVLAYGNTFGRMGAAVKVYCGN